MGIDVVKCEVEFDGDVIVVNGYNIMVCCTENGTWYIDIDGKRHDKTLEQAIKYCMEVVK